MGPVAVTRYALDRAARRLDGGTVLLAGSPLRLFRLTAAGAKVVDAIEVGDDVPHTPAAAALLDRLLDCGAIHPRSHGGRWSPADVTVVVPVVGRDVSAQLPGLGPVARVVVVDDGSEPPLPEPPGTEVLRVEATSGPAAARNAGLAAVTTDLVAFVDADVRTEPGWLDPLLPHFDDERVALVAPRVSSSPGTSLLERYEAARSPLDLGPTEGRVRAGTRIAYVPAAAVVARTTALRQVGGFDHDLRVGEDVDLVWRLDAAGWRVRYQPGSTVRHEPRADWRAWAEQRRGYGRSAAPLAQRHHGALAPVAVSGWSAGAWGLAAAGWPLAALAMTGATSLALARKVRLPPTEALRLAGLGTLYAGQQLGSAITRAWWPMALTGALISRRARRVVLAAALAPPLFDWLHEQPSIDPARYVALRLADDVAYGVGLWQGAVASRTFEPLVPDLTSWPGRGRHDRARDPRP